MLPDSTRQTHPHPPPPAPANSHTRWAQAPPHVTGASPNRQRFNVGLSCWLGRQRAAAARKIVGRVCSPELQRAVLLTAGISRSPPAPSANTATSRQPDGPPDPTTHCTSPTRPRRSIDGIFYRRPEQLGADGIAQAVYSFSPFLLQLPPNNTSDQAELPGVRPRLPANRANCGIPLHSRAHFHPPMTRPSL